MKGEHTVQVLCALLEVSRSGYYRWESSPPTQRQRVDDELADQIIQSHQESRKIYGAPRVLKDLQAQGIKTSKRRCARIMREQGICGRKKHRRRPSTTDSKHAHSPAPNLMREGPKPTGPNQAWITDITCINTGEGWLYLWVVIDCFSRKVVGWSIADHMRTDMVADALRMAAHTRSSLEGSVFHSDHGAQYGSRAYAGLCDQLKVTRSMGAVGRSADNAACESFHASLKRETLRGAHDYGNPATCTARVFAWLTRYNTRRRHSANGHLSPNEYERRHHAAKLTFAA